MHSCCGTFSAAVLLCALCHSCEDTGYTVALSDKGTDTSYRPHEDRTVQYYPASLQLNYQSSTRKDEADRNALSRQDSTCFLLEQSVVPHAYNGKESGAMRMESQGSGTQSWAIGKKFPSDVHYKHNLIT